MEGSTGLRIGQFAQRVGVSRDVLRVWERRYGLLPPRRSSGNYRLYGAEEERIVREVVALRDRGVPISDAVAAARARWATPADGPAPVDAEAPRSDVARAALREAHAAVREFDEPATRATIHRALADLGARRAIGEVVMPLLERVGEDWASGRIGVAHEHMASHVVRREIGAAGVIESEPGAPVVVLACPPGDLHDIVLLSVAVLLSKRGISVRFLGADTPYSAIQGACEQVRPDLLVLSASRDSVLETRIGAIRGLARSWPVAIGGRGATEDLADRIGAALLPDDLDAAIDMIVSSTRAGSDR